MKLKIIILFILYSLVSFSQVKVIGVTSPSKVSGVTSPAKVIGVETSYTPPGNDFYVDGALITSTNGGTSWGDAWESFADIVWDSLDPGDFLYISGGADSLIYYETLYPQCRGTFADRITITIGKYSPSPSGHSGRVIIDGGGNFGYYTGADDNYDWSSFTVTPDPKYPLRTNDYGGADIYNATDGTRGTVVSNTTTTINAVIDTVFEDPNWVPVCRGATYDCDGDWDNGDIYYIVNRGYSINFEDYGGTAPAYTTVMGFETRLGSGGVYLSIDATPITNFPCLVTDSCYIYDYFDLAGYFINGAAYLPEISRSIIKTLVYGGYQTDGIQLTGDATRHGELILIHDNIIYNRNQDPHAHNDAIQGVFYNDGIIAYNNIIINDSVYSPEGGGLPFILSDFNSHGTDYPVILYNNFCYMGGPWYPGANEGYTFWSRFESGGIEAWIPPNYIFNNSIVSNGPRVGGYDNQYPAIIWMNNITAMWCQSFRRSEWRSNMGMGNGPDAGWTSDTYKYIDVDSVRNNLYWKEDSTAVVLAGDGWKWDGGTGSIANWNDFISKGGVGLFRDPLFVNNFGREPDQTQLRPDLQAGSPAIGAGTPIRYLYEYFISEYPEVPVEHFDAMFGDVYGNPRDIDNPSIGCFEYQP